MDPLAVTHITLHQLGYRSCKLAFAAAHLVNHHVRKLTGKERQCRFSKTLVNRL